MPIPHQSTLRQLLDYDPLTGALTWRHRHRSYFQTDRAYNTFNARYAGQPAFTAVGKHGYNVGAIFDQSYRAHRVIWVHAYGIDPDQIDHEDGVRTNNRLSNLKDVSGQQNQRNMKRPVNNTSGAIGVTWDKAKGRWAAHIGVDGRRINLGRFTDINAAIAARNQAEIQYEFHPNHGR